MRLRSVFSFRTFLQDSFIEYCKNGRKGIPAKMQSVMKCGHTLPVFGRVPREGLARLWRTTLLARSSELYLLRRSLRKGVLSPSGQQSFSQRKAERILRRHEQNLCGFRCRSCVRNEMQHTAPAAQEVYKERRQGSDLYNSCRFSRPSRGNRKT